MNVRYCWNLSTTLPLEQLDQLIEWRYICSKTSKTNKKCKKLYCLNPNSSKYCFLISQNAQEVVVVFLNFVQITADPAAGAWSPLSPRISAQYIRTQNSSLEITEINLVYRQFFFNINGLSLFFVFSTRKKLNLHFKILGKLTEKLNCTAILISSRSMKVWFTAATFLLLSTA